MQFAAFNLIVSFIFNCIWKSIKQQLTHPKYRHFKKLISDKLFLKRTKISIRINLRN